MSVFCARILRRWRRSARKAMHPTRVLPKPARDIPELYGVEPSYSIIHSLHLAEGKFFDESDDAASATVCAWARARR